MSTLLEAMVTIAEIASFTQGAQLRAPALLESTVENLETEQPIELTDSVDAQSSSSERALVIDLPDEVDSDLSQYSGSPNDTLEYFPAVEDVSD